jgi:hypothetical protein
MKTLMTEHNLDDLNEELTRIREDHLAKNHCGYFKLWKMTLSKERNSNYSCLPWIRDEVVGIFPTRVPCEEFLDLIERGPEATYEFCLFDHNTDHIKGYWDVHLDQDGALLPNKSLNHKSVSWDWGWNRHPIDFEKGGEWAGKFTGKARTKARAIEVALAYKAEFEEFVRTERPKRAEGCSCSPGDSKPCTKCEQAETERKKQDCGCPNCKGDH